jgi:hypothetical protein
MTHGRRPLALLTMAWVAALYCSGCSDDSQRASSEPNPPILIEPNIAVGKVRTGMRIEEVVALLGQPQRRTANALEYTRLGFAVMPGPDGGAQVIMCGDVTGINGPLVKAFAGHTREGIGLKSTREELLKAYGEPTSGEKLPGGTESLRYDPLGITFTLEGGRVYHMIVRLRGAQQPDRSVTIVPESDNLQK